MFLHPSGTSFPFAHSGHDVSQEKAARVQRPCPHCTVINAEYVKTLLNDGVGLRGGVSTARARVEQIPTEVGNNSRAAVDRLEYAEWPKREISESAEK